MANWTEDTTDAGIGGRHAVFVTPPGGTARDITFLRDVPVQLSSYSSADPFSDSTASLSLPQVSYLDDFTTPELNFIREDTLVDIYWVPAWQKPVDWAVAAETSDTVLHTNPLTGKKDLLATIWDYQKVGAVYVRQATKRARKVWEGSIVNPGVDESGVTLQCQGALFQADSILAKPFFPPNPQTVESLISRAFSLGFHPSLKTRALRVQWPAGWALTAPVFTGSSSTYDPNVKPGTKWTGYTTRSTGSWDHSLTSYIQNMLAVMLVKPGSGAPVGDQWTLRLAHEGDASYPAGRTPVLQVRSRTRPADFSLWAGQRGVKLNLNRDATQAANAIYGTGTDLGGTTWRNSEVSAGGSRTDYAPLAASRAVYPVTGNKAYDKSRFVRESYVQYGAGFSQPDATDSAQLTLRRDEDPGWAGSITIQIDPSPTMSRWQITAGMTLQLKGFLGTGDSGIRLHIASVEANPQDGTIQLTVDTRYRDLLTLNESIARTRDALTPAKLLQLNRNSVTIEDIQAPWDYNAGSGFIPGGARKLYGAKPTSSTYPYRAWLLANPPHKQPSAYVACTANSASSLKRWAGPVRVLMSEKGTIRRSEFVCVDRNGNIVPTRFHVSLYYNNGIGAKFMPYDGHNYSPFIAGAFQSIDPTTGEPWAKPGLAPDASMVMGWGNADQPAGYSPGLKSKGAHPTGLLVDESSWSFDCSSSNPNYDHLAKAGREAASVISVYAMFYCEHPSVVYFTGRLVRQEPGTDS